MSKFKQNLLAAEREAEILEAVSRLVWKSEKRSGYPKIPSAKDLAGVLGETPRSGWVP